jgi:hypothetical protein
MFNFKDASALRALLVDIHGAKQARRETNFCQRSYKETYSSLLNRPTGILPGYYPRCRRLCGLCLQECLQADRKMVAGNSDGTAGNLVVGRTELDIRR